MKKKLCAGLSMMLCAGLLAGCGTVLEADSSTVFVSNKGVVTALEVESFEEDYYDGTELEAYINDAIAEYAKEHGKNAVKVEELTVEGQTAKLRMKYKTTEDYTDFNGIELYQGKVIDTLAAGYTYEGDFVKVEDGKVTGTAKKQEIYKEEGLKAVIIRANMDVKVDGDICYVSSRNVNLTGTDSVSIREGYSLSGGTAEAVAEENEVVTGTELMMESTELPQDTDLTGEMSSGAFETEVYTYIVYK